MYFEHTDKVKELEEKLNEFMEEEIYPNEKTYKEQLNEGGNRWKAPQIMEELKTKAKKQGLWNLFLPNSEYGAGLTNLEYAPLAEIMGRSSIASEVFNCSAPDTGNMEVLVRFGSEDQRKKWLIPLLNGEIRSVYSMTEPEVGSSDATNISTTIVREGDEYVINGRKWFSSGANDPRCKIAIVMGKSNFEGSKHKQHSQILVPLDTTGVNVKRYIPVLGYDDAPHGHAEIEYNNVRVPASNLLLGEGRGFEISQGRLGPGRIHHCMRTIGMAERALDLMIERVKNRVTFGKLLVDQGVIRQWIADSRMEIEQARLLTLKTAYMIDKVGGKNARKEISMIKVIGSQMVSKVVDRAIQSFGAAGVSDDTPLAYMYARARALRLGDGPDEVHCEVVARLELKGK
ncbi:acyl-CoA dehydrogenase family protein [Oceanobacillus longus]|uniref:Acyl-CoA dehydrogenase family protein n=1 Tax=Oceanobacillus longus TaxID=930120 RepID=A0ABV8GUG3_9BACI